MFFLLVPVKAPCLNSNLMQSSSTSGRRPICTFCLAQVKRARIAAISTASSKVGRNRNSSGHNSNAGHNRDQSGYNDFHAGHNISNINHSNIHFGQTEIVSGHSQAHQLQQQVHISSNVSYCMVVTTHSICSII